MGIELIGGFESTFLPEHDRDVMETTAHVTRREDDLRLLRATGVTRLASSPYRRCTQTLDPLGAMLGIPVEADERLAEGAGGEQALALADELRKEPEAAVVCSHGDVIPELLRILKATTARFRDPFIWPKASTWVITWDGDRWSKARYIAPPELSDHW